MLARKEERKEWPATWANWCEQRKQTRLGARGPRGREMAKGRRLGATRRKTGAAWRGKGAACLASQVQREEEKAWGEGDSRPGPCKGEGCWAPWREVGSPVCWAVWPAVVASSWPDFKQKMGPEPNKSSNKKKINKIQNKT